MDLRNLHDIYVVPSMNAVHVTSNPDQFISVLSELNVVLAGSLQIAMIPAIYGTPYMVFVADEMASGKVEVMNVPFVTAAEVVAMVATDENSLR